MSLLSILANVAAFCLGWTTCYLLTHAKRQEAAVSKRPSREHRRPSWLVIVVGLAFIAIGAQQLQFQHNQADGRRAQTAQQACLSRWGSQVVDTLNTRSDATVRLENAKDRAAKAQAELFSVVFGLTHVPPVGTQKDFKQALQALVAANESLDKVQAATNQTRQENPYPEPPSLTCPLGR